MSNENAANWISLIEEFGASQAEQGYSALTRSNYREDLLAFAAWHEVTYQKPPELAEFTAAPVSAWKQHLIEERKLKPRTVNRRLAAIRSFLRWAETTGLTAGRQITLYLPSASILRWAKAKVLPLPSNLHDLSTEHPGRRKPRWLDRREEQALIRAVPRSRNVRDLAILRLPLYAGLQVSELAALRWSDINLDDGVGGVTVRGPVDSFKFRRIRLDRKLRRALTRLKAYQLARRSESDVRSDVIDQAVIRGQRGKMTERGIQEIVARYATSAELSGVTCQVLRHTFCRRLADSGIRLAVIANRTGHASIKTTLQYFDYPLDRNLVASEALARFSNAER